MIRILTDSASDIARSQAKEMGVERIPLGIRFPEFDYDPEQDEDYTRFYELLEKAKQFPTTSQPSPEAFARIFQEAKEAGDSVVAVLISAGLSGTLQSAMVAKESVGYPDIHLIDSRCAIMPQRILVEHAVRLRDAGTSLAELVREVENLVPRVRVWGVLDTLTYLYKGGRLSKSVALAGNLLRIKPIVTAEKGVIALAGRARNYQGVIRKFLEPPGFDPDYPVYFGYTATDATCRKLMRQVQEQCDIKETGICPIGALVGAHVGPNGCAIGYVTASL